MKKHSVKPNLKQIIIRLCELALLVFLLVPGKIVFAQPSRIAIVNIVDSNLMYKHIGFTEFKDKIDTFDCRFNCNKYISQELNRILLLRYTVSFIVAPNSLISPNGNFNNSLTGNNEVVSWIKSLKNKYDFVIIVETGERDDLMDTKKQKLRSSGLYSRGNPDKSWVAVYSASRFSAIRPSNLEIVDYDWSGMDYLLPISDYQFSRQNLLIDPEMLPLIEASLIKLIDYKIEYFLTNSFLMPDADFKK